MGVKVFCRNTKVRKKSLFERKKINGFGDIWIGVGSTRLEFTKKSGLDMSSLWEIEKEEMYVYN